MEKVRDHDQNWRDLCAVASHEDDPIRLASLVNQILQVFEEQEQDEECNRIPSPPNDAERSQSTSRPLPDQKDVSNDAGF